MKGADFMTSFILLCLRYSKALQCIKDEHLDIEESLDRVKQLYQQTLNSKFIDVTASNE